MEQHQIKKLYYSISEVSELTGLKQYVLRYWETEFTQLNPKKNSAGNRIYKINDIDLISEIKSLLYSRKFTIKGAKQHLNKPVKQNSNNTKPAKIIKLSNESDIRTLNSLKQGLNDLRKLINQFKD